jgi:branched-chain amino acid transport system ATP-binding protein
MTVLNRLTAQIRWAAVTTVIGANGAGKSTLVKTAFGLLPVRSGKIFLNWKDITNFTPRQMLDAGVCYIPRGRNIISELSMRHNLEHGGMA